MTLQARDLFLTLSSVPLLRHLDLTVAPGEVTTILGPNGAGKSTLLRCLVGEQFPSEGQVLLNHRLVHDWRPVERARVLSVLPQQSLLDFPFTAAEVVMLGRTPHATGLVHDREIVAAALDMVDGGYLAERYYTQLSGGEKQRVHLARVLAQIWEPCCEGDRYLVLDEPTSSFDLAHQQLTLEIVREFADRGVGVLMVVHDLNLAARCADQLVLMQCGEIVAAGAPLEVLQPAAIRRVFEVDVDVGVHPRTGKPLVIS